MKQVYGITKYVLVIMGFCVDTAVFASEATSSIASSSSSSYPILFVPSVSSSSSSPVRRVVAPYEGVPSIT